MQNNYGFNPYSGKPLPYDANRYVYVNGIEGAKAYSVMPGTSIMLLDCDDALMYKKSADLEGRQSLRYFKIVEITEEELKPKTQQLQNPSITEAQFTELSKKIDDLSNRLEAMSAKVEKPSKSSKMEG